MTNAIEGINSRLDTAKNIYNDELKKFMMMESDLDFLKGEQLSPSASDTIGKYILEAEARIGVQRRVVALAMKKVLDLIDTSNNADTTEKNNS